MSSKKLPIGVKILFPPLLIIIFFEAAYLLKDIRIDRIINSQLSNIEQEEARYQKLKENYKTREYSQAHVDFHRYGEKLYQRIGNQGLVVCDKSFGFGCYHGFFASALADQGTSGLLEMEESCIKKFGEGGLGCQHGIGHGLIEYFGPKKLVDSLKACRTLAWRGRLFGCQDGVFMEYNFPTVIENGEARSSRRENDPKDPYNPCYLIPKEFRESCFYGLPQWWQQIYNFDFVKLGLLCQDIGEKIYEEVCFLGVGNVAPTRNDFSTQESIKLCDQMPDLEKKTLCRAGAGWSSFAQLDDPDLPKRLCEGLPEKNKEYCFNRSNLYEYSKER